MKLDLSEIVTNFGKRMKYEVDEPPLVDPECGLRCIEPITGELVFQNTGRHIVVRGGITTQAELDCSRCLKIFRVPLNLKIEEELPLGSVIPEELEEAELEEEELEDDSEPLFVDNVLDLTELIRQTILVNLPIKPLCAQECEGLCPRCGKVLSQGPCECPEETGSSPFAALSALLDEEKDKKET